MNTNEFRSHFTLGDYNLRSRKIISRMQLRIWREPA
jgi:hypothetical protein